MPDVVPPEPADSLPGSAPDGEPTTGSGSPGRGSPTVPPIVPDLDASLTARSQDGAFGASAPDAMEPASATAGSPRSRRRVTLVLGIVAASLGAAALLVGAAVGLGSLVGGIVTPQAPDQPLIAGDPGDPVAAAPMECPTACFDETSIDALTLSPDTFARLGLTEISSLPQSESTARVGDLVARDMSSWVDYDGEPDDCFFAPTSAPYATTVESSDPDNDDLVYFFDGYDDTVDSGDQAVRIFPDTASASAYLADLAQAIRACKGIEIGPDDDRYNATVSPAAALSLPSEVAAVGWIREGDPGARWRAYVVDLQRGNVVVRIRILTDGVITERQFRNTVERYADQLATVPAAAANVAP
jgi:hypothetical protein